MAGGFTARLDGRKTVARMINDGRFKPGNPGGPGRPARQTEAEYLAALVGGVVLQAPPRLEPLDAGLEDGL